MSIEALPRDTQTQKPLVPAQANLSPVPEAYFDMDTLQRAVPRDRANGVTVLINVLEQNNLLLPVSEDPEIAQARFAQLDKINSAHLYISETMLDLDTGDLDDTAVRHIRADTTYDTATSVPLLALIYANHQLGGDPAYAPAIRTAEIITRVLIKADRENYNF